MRGCSVFFRRLLFLEKSAQREAPTTTIETPAANTSVRKYRRKVVFVGDCNVGKTKLCERIGRPDLLFTDEGFPTIGIDFISRRVVKQGGETVRLQLWDTAGQERFRSLIPSYVRDADVVVFVYDVTKESSLREVDRWNSVWKERVTNSNSGCMLVGTKTDKEGERRITTEEGRDKAREIGAMFFETSAATGDRVRELVDALANWNEETPHWETARHVKACGSVQATVLTFLLVTQRLRQRDGKYKKRMTVFPEESSERESEQDDTSTACTATEEAQPAASCAFSSVSCVEAEAQQSPCHSVPPPLPLSVCLHILEFLPLKAPECCRDGDARPKCTRLRDREVHSGGRGSSVRPCRRSCSWAWTAR
uniref:Uncharacterized protein n=1 Tax=Chromera velia CCMP2878 TaxID=1169474 RepID=A0A0G4ICB9_9ALVE|eukprot:Cvel_13096.t1-p1 / transcript=Cvel_13096.t1 / gene=Cvel_13096 / organism=Chromera_velia_CCMP2878 / gene_product=Ras-related protein Rab-6B, putative / transcript_product=Ras-related protein Rab-6B, putative / location=Cvel_scaffold882:33972-35066(-) / protein_length=365 / sequence_SO=supercontig / SO=protein_coding / is_pseudo=false